MLSTYFCLLGAETETRGSSRLPLDQEYLKIWVMREF